MPLLHLAINGVVDERRFPISCCSSLLDIFQLTSVYRSRKTQAKKQRLRSSESYPALRRPKQRRNQCLLLLASTSTHKTFVDARCRSIDSLLEVLMHDWPLVSWQAVLLATCGFKRCHCSSFGMRRVILAWYSGVEVCVT